MSRLNFLCDALDNQRNLTKWYLKKIPHDILDERLAVNGTKLNSPLWIVSHLIWTDYHIGMLPMGYKKQPEEWIGQVGFKSSGEMPENAPSLETILNQFDEVHQEKLAFFKSLPDDQLDGDYTISSLGFKNNYYALLHLLRHEGVHTGGIATFCKLKGIPTI
ncbi:MAG: DinB family protein [Chitinophagales bacterium]